MVDVDGSYVNGVVSSTYNPVLFTLLLNGIKYGPTELSDVIVTVVAFVAVPVNNPENVIAVNNPVDGSYVNGFVLSTYSPVLFTLLLNGIKYEPAELSVEIATLYAVVDVVELPDNSPLKVVAVNNPIDGTYDNGIEVLSTYNALLLVTVLLNGI
jgi:hypothetical protein